MSMSRMAAAFTARAGARTVAALSATALMAGVLVGLSVRAEAAPVVVPDYFGTDHDDPRTAAAPIVRPDTPSCTVRIVDHGFRDFNLYTNDYTPPAACAGDWSKVVLTLHGAVAGRQFDRLGWLEIGGVPVLKTSTPEPSADGIEWKVEKDLTDYAAFLHSPQQVAMSLGNVVNDTYTGVLDIQVDLTFYTASPAWPAAHTADDVLPLTGETSSDGATNGAITVAPNTERLLAEVYATGSGGGCEEFWYTAAPTSNPDDYSCKTEQGPWREIQVYVDGRLAGIATPYPHIYTGGWSNPYLWYVLPAPRAFDITPVEVDLTPFVGTLTDSAAHQVAIKVVGAEGDGWSVPTGFLAWRDHGSTRVTGAVTSVDETAPSVVNTNGTDGDYLTADLDGSHALTVSGYARTSHGKVTTTVSREVGEQSHHYWTDGESKDGEQAKLTDAGFVRTQVGTATPKVARWNFHYLLDGLIDVTDAGDITTTMTLHDNGSQDTRTGTTRGPWHTWNHAFDGSATWNYLVPRDQRKATGWSEHDFTDRSNLGCWHGFIHTIQGWVTEQTGDTTC